jgi:hypothetical protein
MFYTKSLAAFLTRGKPHLILLQLRERSFISENKLSLYNNLKLYIRIFILPCPFILKSYELHQIVLSSFRIQPRFYHKLSGLFFYGALKFKKSRNTFKLPGHCLFVSEAFRAYKNIDIASCYSIIVSGHTSYYYNVGLNKASRVIWAQGGLGPVCKGVQ